MATRDSATISRLGRRRQVVIPKGICEALDLGAGDLVAVERRANAVVIRPQKSAQRSDTLTRAEERIVRSGMKDVAAGRVVDWEEHKRKHGLGRSTR